MNEAADFDRDLEVLSHQIVTQADRGHTFRELHRASRLMHEAAEILLNANNKAATAAAQHLADACRVLASAEVGT